MMAVPEDHPRLVFLSEAEAITPPAGIIVCLKDRWWSVHPTKGLIFWDKRSMSPQCNGDELMSRKLTAEMYPWAECKFFPLVFRRINPRDYV
jgi:hypothetical protein